MQKSVISVLFSLLILFEVSAYADPIRVTFINPGRSDEVFWVMVSNFMQASANDLGIELEVMYAERNHLKMPRFTKEIAARKTKPDYLVVVNEKLVAGNMLETADEAQIPTFLMLNGLSEEQQDKFGTPRDKLKNWIGTLIPDNASAGYLIAKHTIESAKKQLASKSKGDLGLVAIAGDPATPASVQRVQGLQEALNEIQGVDFKQVIYGHWQQDRTAKATEKLFSRYPDLDILWAANDPMALGALEASVNAGKTPGKDIFISGLNWSNEALKEVKEGRMVTTVGGHFMVGGWVMVLLHDHFHGKDFSDEGLQLRIKVFGAITANNVNDYLNLFGDQDWDKIDFTRFAKSQNKAVGKYDFSLDRILEQFN